jgi:hypothetical protein
METNSLINNLYSRATINAPVPTVGMLATVLAWSDRYAGEVTKIDKNIIHVSTKNHGSFTFKKNRNGKYKEVYKNPTTGRYIGAAGNGLILGKADEYFDQSF